MRASSILALGAAALVSAAPAAPAPLEERADLGEFNVTNFVFGCTSGCYWYFDVTVGPKSSHHPAVTKPVHCEGNLDDNKSFTDGTCADFSDNKAIRAYIGPKGRLNLQYEVNFPKEGSTYWYQGGKKVGAQTSDNPSPAQFTVPEAKASAIA